MKLGVILLNFPLRSEYFITQELRYLKQQGVELYLYPLHRPLAKPAPDEARELLPHTRYLPFLCSLSVWRALLYYVLMHPGAIAAVVGEVCAYFPDVARMAKVVFLLPKICAMAWELRRVGVRRLYAHWATLSATAAQAICTLNGGQLFIACHASDVFVHRNRRGLMRKFRRASAVLTCSQFARRWLTRLYPTLLHGKIYTVYHGLDVEKLAHLTVTEPDLLTIAAGGRLVKKKGLDILLQALAPLAREGKQFSILLFGGGPEKERLQERARELQMSKQLEITGFLDHSLLLQRLAGVSLFVLPSIEEKDGNREGVPNLMLEAMALGKPVVASSLSAIPEVVRDGENGLLVEPNNAEELTRTIKTLMEEPALRRQLGAAARRTIHERFPAELWLSRLWLVLKKHLESEELVR